MLSKLQAAKLATASGVCVAIANGKKRGMLASILAGEFEGTFFPAVEARRSRRRQWILHGRIAGGRQVIVDDGARTALFTHKKSLLPAGIRDVAGTFSPGDVVDIVDTAGKLLGRGVVNYSSPELRSIMGRKTTEIAGILGSKPYDEAVHRDNLVLVEEE
jgi:glutamate 5-kinase